MTAAPLFGVYGAAGFGREIIPLVRLHAHAQGHVADRVVFIDDGAQPGMKNGHRVLTLDEFCDEDASSRLVALAIADSRTRARLWNVCESRGLQPLSVVADNVIIMDDVEIGPGSLLSPFVTLTSNIRIGRAFHANLYSYVGHDCRIGDFVTFAPGVKCNGNIIVEDHAYIGAGAVIRQGRPDRPLTIGTGAIVGMGAVVTTDVPAGITVVGNPARPLLKA